MTTTTLSPELIDARIGAFPLYLNNAGAEIDARIGRLTAQRERERTASGRETIYGEISRAEGEAAAYHMARQAWRRTNLSRQERIGLIVRMAERFLDPENDPELIEQVGGEFDPGDDDQADTLTGLRAAFARIAADARATLA